SSRRRHTRWPRDWSSDVCSSDLHRVVRIFRIEREVDRAGDFLEMRAEVGACGDVDGLDACKKWSGDEEENRSAAHAAEFIASLFLTHSGHKLLPARKMGWPSVEQYLLSTCVFRRRPYVQNLCGRTSYSCKH